MPAENHDHGINWGLMISSSIISLVSIALAWWMYVKKPAAATEAASVLPNTYELSRNRFYIDEIYGILIVKPMAGLAAFCRVFDLYLLDGLVDLLGQVPRFVGNLFRPLQNGLVQFYALLMILGVAGFLLAVVLR
jgi:NADH-quinone oxidoreductase subunit L